MLQNQMIGLLLTNQCYNLLLLKAKRRELQYLTTTNKSKLRKMENQAEKKDYVNISLLLELKQFSPNHLC